MYDFPVGPSSFHKAADSLITTVTHCAGIGHRQIHREISAFLLQVQELDGAHGAVQPHSSHGSKKDAQGTLHKR